MGHLRIPGPPKVDGPSLPQAACQRQSAAAKRGDRLATCRQSHSDYNGMSFPPDRSRAMQRRILIAEDSEQVRQQLKALLEAEGQYAVETVGDGRAALAALTENNYHFFLTDLRMPHLDGLQL